MFKNLLSNIKAVKTALIGSSVLVISENALAFEKATSLINKFSSWLTGIGVAVITIAIMIAGYKILFQGQTFREVAPILIGGILIGSASSIAGIFA